MDVLEARNGLEGLEQVRRNPNVELMLVDWNMPEMNGVDFVRTIRSDRAYDGVHILMVTAECRGEQVSQALSAGVDEYLMKPFNKEVLMAKLNLLDVLPE